MFTFGEFLRLKAELWFSKINIDDTWVTNDSNSPDYL
jgi:hypothetical protein